MRIRMLVLILFTAMLPTTDDGKMMPQPHKSLWTSDGPQLAEGVPMADGTRRA